MNLNAEFDDVFKLLGIASAAETVEQARSFATDAAVALRNRMAALAALPQPGAVEPGEENHVPRCEICDWQLADSWENGCVPGNCSYRPEEPAEQARIRRRRNQLSQTGQISKSALAPTTDDIAASKTIIGAVPQTSRASNE